MYLCLVITKHSRNLDSGVDKNNKYSTGQIFKAFDSEKSICNQRHKPKFTKIDEYICSYKVIKPVAKTKIKCGGIHQG